MAHEAMTPGQCRECKAKALKYKNGIPAGREHIIHTDWKHASEPPGGKCRLRDNTYYVSKRDLDAGFEPTPGVDVVQYEVRYFAPRAHHMVNGNPSGFSGSMILYDEEMAKTNANNSTNDRDSAYVYRMVNGVPEGKSIYVGKKVAVTSWKDYDETRCRYCGQDIMFDQAASPHWGSRQSGPFCRDASSENGEHAPVDEFNE